MNIIQMQDLGYVGVDILENLEEIEDSITTIKTAKFLNTSEFKDLDDLQNFVGHTVEMIKNNLTKLQEK